MIGLSLVAENSDNLSDMWEPFCFSRMFLPVVIMVVVQF